MSFTARYHGTCNDCLGPILPGTEAAYDSNDELVHAGECPTVREIEKANDEAACSSCFLVHAGGCF